MIYSVLDQLDNLERHTQWKIDFLERFNKFSKERIEVEENYAKHMRQLVKRYQIKKGSKEDDECQFTICEAFQRLLSELGDYAGQREVLAEGQKENVLQTLTQCVAESRQQRRKLLQEGRKLQNQLDNSAKQLDMAKRRYERDHRESEKVQLHTEKVEQESAGNKQDLDKVKQQSQQKQHLEEESKRDYASQLELFNEAQRNHYFHTFPSTLQKLQQNEEQATLVLQQCVMGPATQEKAVMPIIDKCLDGIIGAANIISPAKDVDLAVKMYKSGFKPPENVVFENLSCQTLNGASSENSIYRQRQKMWPWRKSKATSPAEDFSHLPPEQCRRRLQERIDELQKNISKEVEQKKGLMKMKDVYIKNSKLGNPSSLEPQLVEVAGRISRLEDELKKYQMWMSSAENKIQNRHSDGDLLQSSFINQPSAPSHIVQRHFSVDEFDDFDDDDDDKDILWCHVLYDFKAQGTDTVSVNKGDKLRVVERDRGDGWTRVQLRVGGEGYVPTTYIKTI
uniref:formin-binding protein 1-like isoform X2 n=1 Tax=Myxine glutinosa TaxID=7769 RepID=UPI00358F2D88